MQVDLKTKIGQWIADNASPFATLKPIGAIYFDGAYPGYRGDGTGDNHGLGETLRVYDDGIGGWYLLGGHCMTWAAIRAGSFESAYDIYLTEFMQDGEVPEDEEEAEFGTWDSCGGWHSEVSLAYLQTIPLDRADAVLIEYVAD